MLTTQLDNQSEAFKKNFSAMQDIVNEFKDKLNFKLGLVVS